MKLNYICSEYETIYNNIFMSFKLNQIVEIKFGPYIKDKQTDGVKYLSASHFDNDANLSLFDENSYVDKVKVEGDILIEGDVLLTGKGNRLFAWEYKTEYGKCVASSLFYVIKVDVTIVLPEYFTLLMNTSRIIHQLELISGGATVPSIPKKELLELEITIPSLTEQKKVIKATRLLDENIKLTTQLLENKKNLKQGVINKLIYG